MGYYYTVQDWAHICHVAGAHVKELAWENVFSVSIRCFLALALQKTGKPAAAAAQMEQVRAFEEKNGFELYVLRDIRAQLNQETTEVCAPEEEIREQQKRAEVECFGGFRVTLPDANAPMKWRTQKAKWLFAYLFHQRGRPVEREKLLAHLWPEADASKTTALLNTTLYSIRKELVPYGMESLIVYQNKSYHIDMTYLHSDLDELERAEVVFANQGALGRVEDHWLRCCEGSYMEGAEEDVYLEARTFYERRCLHLCDKAGHMAEAEKEYETACRYYGRAIQLNPYEEEAYASLIRCYAALGDIKTARAYYEKIHHLLQEDLNALPGETVETAWLESTRTMRNGKVRL